METKTIRKIILSAVAFVALGALSASAFSQSMEFRRGYDQGYRDAVAAMQSGQNQDQGRRDQDRHRGQEREKATPIVIEKATYGVHNAACDARPAVQKLVGWRRHVEIKADNNLCGDSVQGRTKRLDVLYRCGNGQIQRAVAREGSMLSLSCQ